MLAHPAHLPSRYHLPPALPCPEHSLVIFLVCTAGCGGGLARLWGPLCGGRSGGEKKKDPPSTPRSFLVLCFLEKYHFVFSVQGFRYFARILKHGNKSLVGPGSWTQSPSPPPSLALHTWSPWAGPELGGWTQGLAWPLSPPSPSLLGVPLFHVQSLFFGKHKLL